MIYYVLKALDEAETISSITIVGLTEKDLDFEFQKKVVFIEGGKSTFDSVMAAVYHFNKDSDPTKYVFSVSCDIPMITSEMIDRFINAIDFSKEKEYYFPLIWKQSLMKHYPKVTKKPFKIKEGKFYGGDLHIFQLQTLMGREEKLKNILASRKNFFNLVKMISLRNIVRYVLGRLTLNMIEDRFKGIYGLNAAYAIFDFPESCADLDYMEDIEEFDRICSQPPRKLDPEEKVTIQSQYW
jgi:hypothetical protein